MNSSTSSFPIKGVLTGLAAAGIGALYTVFARWGLARGMQAWDLTFLRFAVAGLVMLPVLALAYRRDRAALLARWRIWLLVSLLAGPLFGVLMFGALMLAPASHAAVFPFTAMSVMGMLLSAMVLGEAISARKAAGIAVVLLGLVVLSGLQWETLQGQALLGDLLFIAAGTLWAGFGIVLRRHQLPPMLATAVISLVALLTYVPVYLAMGGLTRLASVSGAVLLTEALVQGLIAGVGTLYAYGKMVSLLGASRAAIFPALAPGMAALLAWPVLDHVPSASELVGLVLVMMGLIVAVTRKRAAQQQPSAPDVSAQTAVLPTARVAA